MQITVPYANLHKEYLECKSEVDHAMSRCIRNSSFINGPEVVKFEQEWAEYTNSEACAGVSSGTSALMLALQALGVGTNDKVLVPSMSFISTAEAVSQLHATPIFVDIDEYHTLDLIKVKESLKDIKAIIFVDLYGQTIDINQLKDIAGDIPIIEDAAQSSVCEYQGQRIGNLVDATCFSYYPGKNLSAMGDAGAVTGSKKIIDQIKMLRDHGRREKYVHEIQGWNERLDGLQASILSAKIPFLSTWNQRRRINANIYNVELFNLNIQLPKVNPMSSHVYNQYVIQLPNRDELKAYLLSKGIEAGIQFPLSMHQQPVYKSDLRLPNSEKLAETCLSLPVHAQCSEDDIRYVCEQINNYFTSP